MKKNGLSKLLDIVGIALMSLMVLSVTLQVVSRAFGRPIDWAGEVARFSFVECVLVGAVIATRDKGHIWIDVLYNHMSSKGQILLTVITSVVTCLFLTMNGYYGLMFTIKQWNAPLAMLPINSGVIYVFHPICFFLMAIITAKNMVDVIRSKVKEGRGEGKL